MNTMEDDIRFGLTYGYYNEGKEQAMSSLERSLRDLFERYLHFSQVAEMQMPAHKVGRLEICEKRGTRYYLTTRDPETKRYKRIYLSHKDMPLIRQMAQQSYDQNVLRLLRKRIKQLQSFLRDFRDDEIEHCFEKLHPKRQELIVPVEPTPKQKLQNWVEEPYATPDYFSGSRKFATKKGEMVRSKSEKILADAFYDEGIPYKYECALYLDTRRLLPDFTFYNPYEEQEMYWEHFGLLEDPDYLHSSLEKLDLYQQNGLFLGQRLIISYETQAKPLDVATVHDMISAYLSDCTA